MLRFPSLLPWLLLCCLCGPLRAAGNGATAPADAKVGTSLALAEERLILATLEQLRGDRREAAALLGISLKTLYSRIACYRARGIAVRDA